MQIPDFPQFADIDLVHSDMVRDILSRHPLEASEYTFTNMFAFRDTYNFKLSMQRDNLIILKSAEPVSMFCPAGSTGITDVLGEMFDYLSGHGEDACLERVPEGFVNEYLMNDVKFIVEEERDHFDYVYDVKELIELKGRKFHDKKNKVNKFRNNYEYEYSSMTPQLIEECLEFEEYWCEERECEKYYGLHKERCAILEMLKNFDLLNIKGGIIRIDGKIAALTLGEKLLRDTFVVHIEKAHTKIPGLYQAINQEFLMHEARDCRFVNREQDLGIQGLRASKMSYNPVSFVKKYKVRKRGLVL